MSKDSKHHALVPRLRFPEFRTGPAWLQKPLGDLTKPITERVGDSDCVPYTVTSGEGLVSQEEKHGRTIAGKSLSNYYRLERDDFAFNKSATKLFPQGYIARFQGDERAAVPSSIFTCFRIAAENVDAAYLDYLFQGNLHGRWLRDFISVGARAHGALNISDDDLYALPVPLPEGDQSLVEQEKIADCLGSLDNLITAEGQKLEALLDHKQGLMQQLFPREGETQPRLRFPEFCDAPGWIEESTNCVCERVMDGTHFSPQSTDGPRPYLTSKNIRNGYLDLSTVTFISEEDHREIYARCPVRKDDVMLTKDGASTGNCAINYLDYEFSLLSSVAVLRGKAMKVVPAFLYYTVASPRYRRQLFDSIAGQAITRITLTKIKEYTVVLPSLEEQSRIAGCLAALDDRTAAQAEKLDALRTHKRGLMQQLFPAAGDLAGGKA